MTVEAVGLGKSYGATRAVDDLSFTLQPGVVTGFLGPNGAGKSTTMRLMLGLDRGTAARCGTGVRCASPRRSPAPSVRTSTPASSIPQIGRAHV